MSLLQLSIEYDEIDLNPSSKKFSEKLDRNSNSDLYLFILELNKIHFDISGKEIKEEQLKNKLCK